MSSKQKRLRSALPGMRSMFDINTISKLIAVVFMIAAAWTVLQRDVEANTDAIDGINSELTLTTSRVSELEDVVEEQIRRDKVQTKVVNWIGISLEKIAKAQGVDLPDRPLLEEMD